MSDLISRQDVIDEIWKLRRSQQLRDDSHNADLVMQGIYLVEKAVEKLPSAQPRKGLWIDIKHTFMTKCSACDWINNDDSSYNFCPNCGADMRQRGDLDDNH